MAGDMIKLKKPLYKDYLHHVKQYAGSEPIQKQNYTLQ